MPTELRSKYRKPRHLKRGDRIAILSPSWGGPALFPAIYEKGLAVLEHALGLHPIEFPTARMHPDELNANPAARAGDLNAAFADESIAGIVASIGGDDSVRILKYLDPKLIANNPKFLMGYSDFTTVLAYVSALGNVAFHGPSVMAGIAQLEGLGVEYQKHVEELLFSSVNSYDYKAFDSFYEGYPDWAVAGNAGKLPLPKQSMGWNWIQRTDRRTGYFWGGCIEVLEFLKGTQFWPDSSFFDDKFLLLETSEEVPSPLQVLRWLRNYGTQTILDRIQGLLVGRPRGYTADQREELEAAVRRVMISEHGRTDIPIVLGFDVGHTDPQLIVPFGILAEMDSTEEHIALIESACR